MSKIKGLDVFFDNTTPVAPEVETKIQSDVLKIFDGLDSDKFAKRNTFGVLGMIAGVALTIVLFVIHVITKSNLTLYFIVPSAILFGVACYGWVQNKKNWLSVVNEKIAFFDLCKSYFEARYENVKVVGHANIEQKMLLNYPGEGVPSDARILKYQAGFAFSIDGIQIHTGVVTWHWYRTVSDGRRSYQKEYKVNKFVSYVPKLPPRWNGFNFSISMSSLFDNKGKELENEKFNKLFSYRHNNPVQLRVLFTPLIQEIYVNYFVRTSSAKTYVLDLVNEQIITSKMAVGGDPFVVDKVPFGKKALIAKRIISELEGDFRYLEEQISIITTLRELLVDR